jgi:hypothetical protein
VGIILIASKVILYFSYRLRNLRLPLPFTVAERHKNTAVKKKEKIFAWK